MTYTAQAPDDDRTLVSIKIDRPAVNTDDGWHGVTGGTIYGPDGTTYVRGIQTVKVQR